MPEERAWQEVANYGAMYEAEMAAARLTNAGIPAQVRGERGMFGAGYAGGVPHGAGVWVPSEYLEDAVALIGDEPVADD